MRVEWDVNKNQRNMVKHQISFELAQCIFDDPLHLSIQDRYVDGEERWQTIGNIGGCVVALVAHTLCEQGELVIRIISARKATKKERTKYEQLN